ncbi:MAG: hypothetical protein P8N09_12170 [Planctomycetota bacterium]|jgi:hypothetical protein|nr:hypothetical protein [Planctomycetota bacterium]
MPQPEIAEILKEHFVGLASDCDAPEPEVVDLISTHLADGMMLPFVLITDADGAFLTGWHGSVSPETMKDTLSGILP